jgi:hypothetical protein
MTNVMRSVLMNRLSSRRQLWLAIAVLALPTWVAAQAVGVTSERPANPAQPTRDRPAPPQRVGTAVLKGRVVDGVTSQPVPRARVRLSGPGVARQPLLTDAEGAFEFTRLPPGPYSVEVQKSTYLAGRYPDAARSIRARSQPLVLQDGQAIENFTIPIFHGGAIAGRVFDAHGDPVDMAQVRALRLSRGGRPTMAGQMQSNDLGEFRIPRLQPGRYIMQVRPQMSQNFFSPDPSVIELPLPQPLPTYYPSALALSQATPVTVNRGETLTGIDLTLAEGTPTLVTGTVLRTDGQPAGNGSITARVVGSEANFGFDSGGGTGIRPGGEFRLTLPPGEYALEAQLSTRQGPGPSGPDDQLFGTTRISVGGGGVENVTITVGRGATASGRVVFEGTTPPPPSPGTVGIPVFNPDGPGCRSAQATIAADWTFKVESISGTCGAPPQGMFGRWTLKAVTFRGQNLMEELVTFETGQQYTNVQVVVTDKRTQMDLHVSGDDGQPTREYVALAFPLDKAKWNPQLRRVRTYTPPPPPTQMPSRVSSPPGTVAGATLTPIGPGSGGIVSGSMVGPMNMMMSQQERITGLPPGEYYVIAIDDIEGEDSQDPAVLERLTSSAIRVVLTDDAPIEVPLRRFNLADVVR